MYLTALHLHLADAARMWCAEAKFSHSATFLIFWDAARMWCAEAKSVVCLDPALEKDAARMWCAEAKPDDVDLHFNAT